MRIILIAMGLATTTGCATAVRTHIAEINSGMSQNQVMEIMGKPDDFWGNGNSTVLTYTDQFPYYECHIKLVHDEVVGKKCQTMRSDQSGAAMWQNISNNLSNRQSFGNFYNQPAQGNIFQGPAPASQPNYMNQCSRMSIAPIANIGCHKSCINGQWADVCP